MFVPYDDRKTLLTLSFLGKIAYRIDQRSQGLVMRLFKVRQLCAFLVRRDDIAGFEIEKISRHAN